METSNANGIPEDKPIVNDAINKIKKDEIRFATKACGKCALLNPLAKKLFTECKYYESEECTANGMKIIVGPDPSMIIKAYSNKLSTYMLANDSDNLINTLKVLIKKAEHSQHFIDIIFSWFEMVMAKTKDDEDIDDDDFDGGGTLDGIPD